MPRIISYADAVSEAMMEEMERDETVVLWGEDVGGFGGAFGELKGVHKKFGEKRVIDMPIAETYIAGAAIGAAITGLRPVAELMYADFITVAMDEITKAAKWRYMHGGLFDVPATFPLLSGAVGGAGPEHSQCPEAMLWGVAGLYIVCPTTPADVKGLLKSCIRDNNPTVIFMHKALFMTKGEVPDGDYLVPIGEADVKREGTDVTVVAWQNMVQRSLEAADELAKEGISVEVIDPRGLRPFDMDTVLKSLEKTGRIVFAHEAPKPGGPAAEIAAQIAEVGLDLLQSPIKRVAPPFVPVPQSMMLEQVYIPSAADIVKAIREVV